MIRVKLHTTNKPVTSVMHTDPQAAKTVCDNRAAGKILSRKHGFTSYPKMTSCIVVNSTADFRHRRIHDNGGAVEMCVCILSSLQDSSEIIYPF